MYLNWNFIVNFTNLYIQVNDLSWKTIYINLVCSSGRKNSWLRPWPTGTSLLIFSNFLVVRTRAPPVFFFSFPGIEEPRQEKKPRLLCSDLHTLPLSSFSHHPSFFLPKSTCSLISPFKRPPLVTTTSLEVATLYRDSPAPCQFCSHQHCVFVESRIHK